MYLILIIGATGQGKSPFVREFIKGKNCLVFDVQDEYGERTKYAGQEKMLLPINNKLARSRYIGGDKNEFINICSRKRNTVCVFEEATIFFEGKTDEKMRRLIFSKAHTRNNYLLVFHSINSVPPRIMESANFAVLFRTNDEAKKVASKFRTLLKPYIKLKQNPKLQPIKIKMI